MTSGLLLIEVVSPANLGSSFGLPTLARPTQKDGLNDLPFLPDSALKGVLAGGLGEHVDVEEGAEETPRERLFGSPDRGERQGRPAAIVVGNGELLCFPLPTAGGGRAWVFPAALALKHCELALRAERPSWLAAAASLVAGLEVPAAQREVLAAGAQPEPLGSEPLRPRSAGAEETAGPLLATLARLATPALPPGEPWLLTGSKLAAELWQGAAELRTSTALDGASRTVRRGTLRTVELIPPGTLFLSLVTCTDATELRELAGPIQVGAWESLGLGWVRLSQVEEAGGEPPRPVAASPAAAGARPFAMDEMLVAVQALSDAAARLRIAARAAVFNFGPRARLQGLEAAVAFALAKAKPRVRQPKPEALAHRWLCRALLGAEEPASAAQGEDEALLGRIDEGLFTPGHLAARRQEILDRWLWLRRHAELGLAPAPGASAAGGEEVP